MTVLVLFDGGTPRVYRHVRSISEDWSGSDLVLDISGEEREIKLRDPIKVEIIHA